MIVRSLACVFARRAATGAIGAALARSLRMGLLMLIAGMPAAQALMQTGWQSIRTPNGGSGVHCYDPDRDRMVYFDGTGTYEYDGDPSGLWTFVSSTSPPLASSFSGIAYDRRRQRVVYNDRGNTWEWDGSTWTLAAPFPPIWSFMAFVSHTGRGSVLAFGGPDFWNSNDLYEWTGTAWTLLPTTGRPPRPGDWNSSRIYLTAAYDARRDKLVVFGSAQADWFNGGYSNYQPDLWEWDAGNGWVQRVVQQGSIERTAKLFFDSQRGVVTLVSGYPTPIRVAEWDGGTSWQPITPAMPLPPSFTALATDGDYDDLRGRFYAGLFGSNTFTPYAYRTLTPARFDPLDPGCTGTLGEPALRLTHNWTRAWLGRSLSVDLTNLPSSAGIVALGWSNQQHGSISLPLSLAQFGVPGCFVRVAPDAVHFVSGTNDTATLTLPVPANPALLGSGFYQQGWSFDPSANPMGLITSNSVRLTIGQL